MIKIAVLSDTHNLLRPQVLEIAAGCQAIIHAGDFSRESVLDAFRPLGNIYVVRGNNDQSWAGYLKDTLRFQIGGIRFFLTHNKKDVDRRLDDVDVVIFGHSHKYFQQMIDGRLWLNPGSCGYSRFGGEVTMAVMEIDENSRTWAVEKIVLPLERMQ
ncbi:hypothetical protein HNP82_001432 [Catenibacillus scindens]|uniref:Phosphoesterase n=1 Tax=Catenibacillus scindens TaxID=673271 RepID=A0A7W8H9E5_9FIRM|nr:metallophosphoesterase family protein [Catenibacillus scindens]MBB5264321.1 hypothetical protein [Catenibacillus scindens]